MTKQERLDQIKADILEQNICPDLAKEATNMVFGAGNPDADIVFIGEAPGKNEDLTGEPFIGSTGKFLDELFASVNLERKDIYITSIVKYRPPKNRDPKPEEKEQSWPFLLAQLAVIEPKLIVTLGRHSTNCFLPGVQISTVHGHAEQIKIIVNNKEFTWTILPLFHPSAALYNGTTRKVIIQDFQLVRTTINKIKK